MTTPSPTFPFLALPFELRTIIYKNLLTTDTAPNLYHSRRGRDRTLQLDPAILRVNRQIYTEASCILYEQNEFRIVLCRLFCTTSDDDPEIYHPIVTDYSTGTFPQTLVPLWYNDPFVHVHGVVYPHCLSRMHHIRLVTATGHIIAHELYFTSAGRLMIEIWRCLVDGEATDVPVGGCAREKKKSLEMVIFGLEDIKEEYPELGDIECLEMLFREGLELEVMADRRSPEHVKEACELLHAMERTRVCSVHGSRYHAHN